MKVDTRIPVFTYEHLMEILQFVCVMDDKVGLNQKYKTASKKIFDTFVEDAETLRSHIRPLIKNPRARDINNAFINLFSLYSLKREFENYENNWNRLCSDDESYQVMYEYILLFLDIVRESALAPIMMDIIYPCRIKRLKGLIPEVGVEIVRQKGG